MSGSVHVDAPLIEYFHSYVAEYGSVPGTSAPETRLEENGFIDKMSKSGRAKVLESVNLDI